MERKLTGKQEAFAVSYVETGNASEAYRRHYKADGMTENTLNVEACKLLKHPKVSQRVAELQAPVVQKAQITLEKHLDDLLRLRNMAVKDAKWSAAIQAEVARGKAAGLYLDKVELTGKDGAPVAVTNVPVSQYIEARAKVLGDF